MCDPRTVWWKNATCYQIWPASYKDSNGDGMGDIPGAISTLDYLKDLGIDMIWLSPMYDSPQHDMGYDISNYEDVWSKYGTLADMDTLILETHARGMRLILDLVVNHTSDEHRWFRESRKNRHNAYSDWYIWRDPKYVDGVRCPPTNWRASFGGSAWEYAPERDQYYLHLFTSRQPDLNWENPATRRGIYQTAIEFWLDKGVDGFRVDTVNLYSKNLGYPDATITDHQQTYQNAEEHYVNGPRMHEWLREQRREVLDKYGDVFLVGELPCTKCDDVVQYVSAKSRELDCVFDFGICELGGRYGRQPHETWQHTLPELKAALQKTQDLLKIPHTWTTVFAENHDLPRSISTFGSTHEPNLVQSGRLLAILLATLSGTLFLYQGQEIGMTNIPTDAGNDYFQDICGRQYLKEIQSKHAGDPEMLKLAHKSLCRCSRDNARTPVQWDDSPNAGFTSGQPWAKVHSNYNQVNVRKSQADPHGVLAMWKQMLRLRKQHAEVLVYGGFEVYDFDNMSTFIYIKRFGDKKALVTLNFTDDEQELKIPPLLDGETLELLVANVDKPGHCLTPWEGRVYLVNSST